MSRKINMPKQQYIVAVTRGTKTRYTYGETLKDAVNLARISKGDSFYYSLFSRQFHRYAEVTAGTKGNVKKYHVPLAQ